MKINKKAKDETSFIKPSLSFGKRGIMVKFLLTLILAIIIFVPACLFVSNFLRLSSQANENFGEFVQEIGDLAEEGKEMEKRNTILIMDENTFVANLWSNYLDEFKRCPNTPFKELVGASIYAEEHWMGVGNSCRGNDCICLIREYEYEETSEWGDLCGNKRIIVKATPIEVNCIEIPEDYYVYSDDWWFWTRFGEDNPRRFEMQMIKKGKMIFICRGPPCEIPSQLEKHPTKS